MSETDILYRPWGIVTSEFWERPQTTQQPAPVASPQQPYSSSGPASSDDGSPEVPAAYRDGILQVTSAFSSRDPQVLRSAQVEAERLDQAMTAEYGEHDLRTISVREMRGWLAHLTGEHETASRWYLHTVGLLSSVLGTSDDRTRASAKRAVATWLSIADQAVAKGLAPTILAMAEEVEGKESSSANAVRRRANAGASAA
ncbi:hypothetical protein [Streptomyces chartreusis]|uniref:Uncharacterized protein n=1 Tax=Streptomyces chartreusis TaxID=1969 RepID=A0A7H8TBN7_STRCX|nr:hypothetical protein [Streptomyces chartreusis]QKZ20372.1 hypothetical protein HUT05_25285 [Streptomyces chartreusis]